MKTGIFGGSFNPVHLGHLIITESFSEKMELDRVVIIPANISPFKSGNPEEYAPGSDRIKMLQLAYAPLADSVIETYEIDRKGLSYTADTLKYIRKKYPDDDLYFLIGEDQALTFPYWHNPQEIASCAQICIADRDVSRSMHEKILSAMEKIGITPIFINSPLIEISSTEIRNRINCRKSINFLTPPAVIEYIKSKNLYAKI